MPTGKGLSGRMPAQGTRDPVHPVHPPSAPGRAQSGPPGVSSCTLPPPGDPGKARIPPVFQPLYFPRGVKYKGNLSEEGP